MPHIFSPYFSKTALLQIVVEAGFLFAVVLFGLTLTHPGPGSENVHFWAPALLIAAFLTASISAAGLYRKSKRSTFSRSAAKFVFAFVIGFPILYASFDWMQFEPAVLDSLALTNLTALSGILVLRAATNRATQQE